MGLIILPSSKVWQWLFNSQMMAEQFIPYVDHQLFDHPLWVFKTTVQGFDRKNIFHPMFWWGLQFLGWIHLESSCRTSCSLVQFDLRFRYYIIWSIDSTSGWWSIRLTFKYHIQECSFNWMCFMRSSFIFLNPWWVVHFHKRESILCKLCDIIRAI